MPVTRYVFPRLAELERLGLLDTPRGKTGCIWLRQWHHDHSRLPHIHPLVQPVSHRRYTSVQQYRPQTKHEEFFTAEILVSRPGEFHPQPLAEPYVILSHHTAPIIQPLLDHINASGLASLDEFSLSCLVVSSFALYVQIDCGIFALDKPLSVHLDI